MNEKDTFAELFKPVKEAAKRQGWETVVKLGVEASTVLKEAKGMGINR